MALSSCLCQSLSSSISIAKNHDVRMKLATCSDLRSVNTQISGRQVVSSRTIFHSDWSFVGGSRINLLPKVESNSSISRRKVSGIQASWFTTSQIASSMFTIGTAAVLPFYTLMVVAPKAEVTKKCMESSVPYIVLGLLYAYLLYLSWTPNTLLYMFSNKYMLPELPGIAKMFSSEITLASAWIHLLVIDLFAARQVFHDGLENKIETRHSISLCLLFCPIGVCSHFITKALTSNSNDTKFDE